MKSSGKKKRRERERGERYYCRHSYLIICIYFKSVVKKVTFKTRRGDGISGNSIGE